jgi:prepilin-type N-terminal cleavage/methylation domain-containing protein
MKKIPRNHAVWGFTLLELMVVIAIIGILAAIVLASLSAARTKARDVSVKSEMHNIRSAADLYYTSHNSSYSLSDGTAGSCSDTFGLFGAPGPGAPMWGDTSTNMKNIMLAIFNTVGTTANMDCGTSAGAWSMAVQLPSGSYWCVDSTGAARGAMLTGLAYISLTSGPTSAHNGPGATVCN